MSRLVTSFRGIPFGWDERGGEITPRFVNHDFPQRDGRFHEDMAKGPRLFTFDGYLLAGSAELVRAKLRAFKAACADQRPGTLLHPTFGAVRVICIGCKHKEHREKLNRIDLDLTFEEDAGGDNPVAGRWLGAALNDAVAAAGDAIGAALDEVWDLVEMPAYVIDEATAGLGDLAAQVFGTLGLLTAPVRAAVSAATSPLTDDDFEFRGLSSPLRSLFGSYTTDDHGRLLPLSGDEAAATASALATLSLFALPNQPLGTPERAKAARALDGLAAAVRRFALVQEANASRLRSFVSSNQAIDVRDDLADRLDVEILAAADQASIDGNDTLVAVSDALGQARAEMITDLTARAASLKPVATITLKRTLPALVLAYTLYGDGEATATDRAATLARADDLFRRNGVRDPGAMPGGVPLEYQAPA